MAWWHIAIFIGGFFLSFLATPKTQTTPPVGLDELDLPTAEVGREIPVFFGTCKSSSANIVWYGDLRTTPIKAKTGKK